MTTEPRDQRHLGEQTIVAWLERRLGGPERALAEQHVHGCGRCRRLLAAVTRAIDDEQPPPRQGARVGPYVLEAELGAGAMGTVFRAKDPRLGRRVALKIVHHPGISRRRVRLEGRTLARLNHPAVVTVLGSGDSALGPWLAMELVDGWTLRGWVEARRPSRRARAEALLEAAAGLQAIHEAGVVHGDLKPGNILVSRDGRVRVADFGLASIAREARSSPGSASPEEDAPGGTPAYMAPEVLGGAPSSPLADQFAFCVTAWEVLTGERPFGAASRSQLIAAVEAGSVRAPARPLPPRWGATLRRGLRADPRGRFPGMRALVDRLRAARRRRLMPLAVAASLGLGLAVWWSPSDPCDSALTAAANAADVLQELEPTGQTDSAGSWLSDWKAARTHACRTGSIGEAQCLDAAIAKVHGRLAAASDGESPDRGLLSGIDPPHACADALARSPPQPGPQHKLEREMQRARGQFAHRPSERARRVFAALVRRADELRDPRLQARARVSYGQMLDWLSYREAAQAAFDRAYFSALRADAPGLAVMAATSLAQLHADRFTQLEPALRWIQHARALLPRCRDESRRPRLEMIHSEILHMFGRVEEATTHGRAARAALGDDAPPRLRASIEETLGNLAVERGEYDSAIEHFQAAIAVHESRGAPGRFDLPRALNGLAAAYTPLERYDEAIAQWTRMRSLLGTRKTLDVELATLDSNLGAVHSIVGDHETALRYFATGCASAARAYANEGPVLSRCRYGTAYALGELGRWSEAAVAAEQAIDAAMSGDPPALALTLDPLRKLGTAREALGDPDGAVAAMRRRVGVYEELASGSRRDPASVARARLDLADILARAQRGSAAKREAQRVLQWLEGHEADASGSDLRVRARRIALNGEVVGGG
ncbi:MAG: serine/threonine-protein kinase [Myxococcota bacterium]